MKYVGYLLFHEQAYTEHMLGTSSHKFLIWFDDLWLVPSTRRLAQTKCLAVVSLNYEIAIVLLRREIYYAC